MRKFNRSSAIDLVIVFFESRVLVLLAPLRVAKLCFSDLVLVDESNHFLLLTAIPNHVTNFIDRHHISRLLVTGDVGSCRGRGPSIHCSKRWEMIFLHGLLLTPSHWAPGNRGWIDPWWAIIWVVTTSSNNHHTFIILYISIGFSNHGDILPGSNIAGTCHQLLLLLRLLCLTQLLQTLLIVESYLVKELLAPRLKYLLILLLFVLGRNSCSIGRLSGGRNLESDFLPFLDLIETKRKMIRHDLEAAKLLHIELLSASFHLYMAMDHHLELAY